MFISHIFFSAFGKGFVWQRENVSKAWASVNSKTRNYNRVYYTSMPDQCFHTVVRACVRSFAVKEHAPELLHWCSHKQCFSWPQRPTQLKCSCADFGCDFHFQLHVLRMTLSELTIRCEINVSAVRPKFCRERVRTNKLSVALMLPQPVVYLAPKTHSTEMLLYRVWTCHLTWSWIFWIIWCESFFSQGFRL